MKEGQEQGDWYDLVRRADGEVVGSYNFDGNSNRVLFYRDGDKFSIRPMAPDELIGDLSLFTQMLINAGYRPSALSDIVPSSA